jgi:hypothetical protein
MDTANGIAAERWQRNFRETNLYSRDTHRIALPARWRPAMEWERLLQFFRSISYENRLVVPTSVGLLSSYSMQCRENQEPH